MAQTISDFKVEIFTFDEMRTLVRNGIAKDVSRNIRVTISFDGEFELASGNPTYQNRHVFWTQTSFAAHRDLMAYILQEIL